VAGDALRDPFIERNSLPREVTGTVPDLTRGLTVWLDQAVVIVTLARRLLGMAIAGLIGLGSVVLGIVVLLTLGQCNPVKAPLPRRSWPCRSIDGDLDPPLRRQPLLHPEGLVTPPPRTRPDLVGVNGRIETAYAGLAPKG
jgi:hypothetical protein